MFSRFTLLITIVTAAASSALAAQEPQTREEIARQQRAEKAKEVKPYQPSAMERWLLKLEDDRVFERLLNPAEGFFPKIGHITPGSGLSLGPGYRRPRLFGDRAELIAFAAGSFKKYWLLDGRLLMPSLARGRAFVEVYGQSYEWPQESFFGLGPASRRDDQVSFRLRNTTTGASGGARIGPFLAVGGRLERLMPEVGRGTTRRFPSIQDRFVDLEVPGIGQQPDFNRLEIFSDFNYGRPRGNPRNGGRYYVGYHVFDDRDFSRYNFHRLEVDLRQYISLLKERRVLALRALTSMSDADAGQQVPFYLQRTLGGPDDLRGFRRFRFRDRNLLLLQAEYRWEVFTAMDAAFFYDAGQVAPRREELSLRHLEKDYGFGVRFGTDRGVFLRIEGAFGSRDGKHFILRFGNAF